MLSAGIGGTRNLRTSSFIVNAAIVSLTCLAVHAQKDYSLEKYLALKIPLLMGNPQLKPEQIPIKMPNSNDKDSLTDNRRQSSVQYRDRQSRDKHLFPLDWEKLDWERLDENKDEDKVYVSQYAPIKMVRQVRSNPRKLLNGLTRFA